MDKEEKNDLDLLEKFIKAVEGSKQIVIPITVEKLIGVIRHEIGLLQDKILKLGVCLNNAELLRDVKPTEDYELTGKNIVVQKVLERGYIRTAYLNRGDNGWFNNYEDVCYIPKIAMKIRKKSQSPCFVISDTTEDGQAGYSSGETKIYYSQVTLRGKINIRNCSNCPQKINPQNIDAKTAALRAGDEIDELQKAISKYEAAIQKLLLRE